MMVCASSQGDMAWITIRRYFAELSKILTSNFEFFFLNFLFLFQTCHIFHEYEHFLIVIASAVDCIRWFGLIESKLKYFVQSVEKEVESARIWPKPYTKKERSSVTQLWFIGLTMREGYEPINING